MNRIFKNLLFIFILLLTNINSYAAVVSDNDGSAFITKAEFDSLNNNFQAQIDSFNGAIDSKIDSAISSYLAGIKISTTREGTNFVRNMNNKRPVRFYNYSSNTFNISTIDKLKIKYLWRLFGNFYYPNIMLSDKYANYAKGQNIDGSFLQDLFSATHNRGFIMSEKGNDTNYQYQTTKYTYSGNTYYALDEPQTKSLQCTVGAYYYYLGSSKSWSGLTIPNKFEHKTRDVVIPFTTNTIEPGNIDYDLKFMTVRANGASWNIWKKSDNTVDCDFVYDFTNTTYDENKDILVYNIYDFNNWTVQETLSHANGGVDSDFWFSFFGDGQQAAYRRTYTYINQGTHDYGITGSTDNTKKSTMKYYRPKIDSIKSGKLINDSASAQIEKPVKAYNGAPLTTMIKDAKKAEVKINVKIYDSTNALKTNAPYTVLLRNKPFDNTNSSTYISGSDSTIKKWSTTSGSTGNADFSFELDKTYLDTMSEGDVMYMRIAPSTAGYHADLDCSEIKFEVE